MKISTRSNPVRVALAAINLALCLLIAAFGAIMRVPSPDLSTIAFVVAIVPGVAAGNYWVTRRRKD